MIRQRLGRFATVLTAATFVLMLVGVGSVAAKNPSWDIQIVKLPPVVGAGHDAGYRVTVSNAGPSNINTLSMTVTPASTPTAAPTYFSGLSWNFGAHGSCTGTGPGGSGPLTCDLGTLTAGQSTTFTVAYNVPTGSTGSFDVTVAIQSGSGNTGTDPGTSRGDAFSKTASTGISSSTNFDAGFVVDDLAYSTTGTLGRGNKQNSTVEVTDTLLTVTVADGNQAIAPTCTDPACNSAFGEWTNLGVPGNTNLIKVTLNIWGGAVPGGVSTDQIYLIHVLDNGTVQVIGDDLSERCDPATGVPNNPQCVTVTKIGSNYRIVGWLFQNGSIRGGF